jgi:hypothetical protein
MGSAIKSEKRVRERRERRKPSLCRRGTKRRVVDVGFTKTMIL